MSSDELEYRKYYATICEEYSKWQKSTWSFTNLNIRIEIQKINSDHFLIVQFKYETDISRSSISVGSIYSIDEIVDMAVKSDIARGWYQ